MSKTVHSETRIRILLILALALIVFMPLLGSLFKWGGLPPGYGEFPSQKVEADPGFNPTIFWVGVAFEALCILFMAFPRLFGFKKAARVEGPGKAGLLPLPRWFWIGLVSFGLGLGIFWGRIPWLDAIDPILFVPIWWGMILMLDAWVYRRKGGQSLLATKPQTMVLLAVVSSAGWFLFEYLDFFVMENWYYPNNHIFSAYGNIVWFLCSYTIIFPQLFELYQLFETVPGFAARYSQGPRIHAPRPLKWGILVAGAGLSFLLGLFPYPLFFTIWTNPVLIMAAVLGLCGVWNLFTPIGQGNWAPLILSGIAMVLCGLSWEIVNFGSEYFFGYQAVNPSYWKYSVPYVNDVHLPFTEMPLLGYGGYVPYAWVCWLQWGLVAKLFGFDPSLAAQR